MTKRTKGMSKKDAIYDKILQNNLWSNKATENTALVFANPDEIVRLIYTKVDQRLRENIEGYLSMSIFTDCPVTRVNLNAGN